MKRLVFTFTCLIVIVSGCKKGENTPEPCHYSTDFNLSQLNQTLTISPNSSSAASYEIEYGPKGFLQGAGTKLKFGGTSYDIEDIPYGKYDIYMKTTCKSGVSTDWSSAKSFTIDGSSSGCDKPRNLYTTQYISSIILEWDGTADYYQVQYGETGFQLGTGAGVQTNLSNTSEITVKSGKTYDFYVRGNCGGSKFSGWEGPSSFVATKDYTTSGGVCNKPTNLYAYKKNSQEISYSFDASGASSYEISFSNSFNSTGNIYSENYTSGTIAFTSNAYYTVFWARSKCGNTFTPWVSTAIQ